MFSVARPLAQAWTYPGSVQGQAMWTSLLHRRLPHRVYRCSFGFCIGAEPQSPQQYWPKSLASPGL